MQLELACLLHRQLRRPLALEDAAGIDAGEAMRLLDLGTVADQATGGDEFARRMDRRDAALQRERRQLFVAAGEERIVGDDQAADVLAPQVLEAQRQVLLSRR